MKLLTKKMLTTTLAASVILGGGVAGLLQSKAFADETSSSDTTTPAVQQKGEFSHFKGDFRKSLNGDFQVDAALIASVVGIEQADVQAQLDAGKTPVDIATANGTSQESLVTSVRQILNSRIDSSLSSNKINTQQADALRSKLEKHLEKELTSPIQKPDAGKGGKGDKGRGGKFGMFGAEDQLSTILGLSGDELKSALQSGQSIAELAQSKGISQDDLVAKLKDGLTDSLTQWVQQKHQPRQKPEATPAPETPAVSDDESNS